MRKNKLKKWKKLAVLMTALCLVPHATEPVYGYSFSKTGAYQDGTVTITQLPSGEGKNGYYLPGEYQVDYTLTADFVAFRALDGCDFYIGNDLQPQGGCQFVYQPNGVVWEQGALQLGAILDGVAVGSAEPDSNSTVHVSFRVANLSQLPNYIGYTYEPASGAYVHATPSYGQDHHVWYYQNLKNATEIPAGNIDVYAPALDCRVVPSGTVATVNNKTFGTTAMIHAEAVDTQSRPAEIRLMKDGKIINRSTNEPDLWAIFTDFPVNENGTYTLQALDQLGNASEIKTVIVDCIDMAAPQITSYDTENKEYCTSTVLKVNATDTGSGLADKAYSFNGGSFGASNQITITENGTYTVRVRDHVGNESTKRLVVTNIDRTLPVISAIRQKNDDYCTKNTLSIEAYDLGSGLHALPYSFNNGEWSTEKEYEVAENGTYTVKVRDALGNIAEQSATVNNIDLSEPELTTEIGCDGEKVIVGDEEWYQSKYLLVTACDTMSGPKMIQILDSNDEVICEKSNENATVKELSLKTQSLVAGIYSVIVHDFLDNVKKEIIEIGQVDHDPPEIKQIEQKELGNGMVRITVFADDGDGSGLPKEAYSFDGGKTWQADNFYDVDENGIYDIAVRDCMNMVSDEREKVDSVKKKTSDILDNKGNQGGNDGTENPGEKDRSNGNASGGDASDGNDRSMDTSEPRNDVPDDINNGGLLDDFTVKQPDKTKNGRGNETDQSQDDSEQDDVNDSQGFTKDANENKDVKQNNITTVTKVENKEKLGQNTVPMQEASNPTRRTEEKVKQIAAIALSTLLGLALLGLGLYLYLMGAHYSCIMYERDKQVQKRKICRIPVKAYGNGWLVEVKDDQLGKLGTGRYLFAFKPAFVKEEAPADVVILIDKNKIKEELREEIEIQI